MNFLGLAFLLAAHFFSGRGILRLFRLQLKPYEDYCISLMLGVPLLSFVPCFIQLAGIPITAGSVASGIAVFTALCSIPLFLNIRKPQFGAFSMPKIYEWPFIFVLVYLTIISVWRAFYLPPFAADMLNGPELLAEYTVREKTMLNSVFTVDLNLTGPNRDDASNIFKSPYITGLQIIYKLLVQPFGQMWMSVLYVPFIIWFYQMIRERIHGFIAGILLFIYLICPDLFAYSYVMLYDYSNVIFFLLGYWLLIRYLDNGRWSSLACSSFMFGISTFIRVETLMLVALFVPLLIVHYYRTKAQAVRYAAGGAVFFAGSIFFYVLCQKVFLPNFVPFKFSNGSLMNSNWGNLWPLFDRLSEQSSKLLFGKMGEGTYGHFFYFFAIVLVTDLVWPRRFNRESLLWLYGIFVVYFGLAMMGYIFPFVTIDNTVKRGLFKLMPFVLLYLSNSGLLLFAGERIRNWELDIKVAARKPRPAAVPVKAAKPQPKPPAGRNAPKKR